VVFLILPMKKAVNKAKYTNPNKRDIIILMNISKLSHIYTNPLWDLKEKRYERKNSKRDRKSTRLNSSHDSSSYAVFCLKKKTTLGIDNTTRTTIQSIPSKYIVCVSS